MSKPTGPREKKWLTASRENERTGERTVYKQRFVTGTDRATSTIDRDSMGDVSSLSDRERDSMLKVASDESITISQAEKVFELATRETIDEELLRELRANSEISTGLRERIDAVIREESREEEPSLSLQGTIAARKFYEKKATWGETQDELRRMASEVASWFVPEEFKDVQIGKVENLGATNESYGNAYRSVGISVLVDGVEFTLPAKVYKSYDPSYNLFRWGWGVEWGRMYRKGAFGRKVKIRRMDKLAKFVRKQARKQKR